MNRNNARFPQYGGRGITVCERWNDFSNFMADMGCKPKDGRQYSIERIDNNGPYSPDNCKWIPMSQQVHNRSISKRIMVNGIPMSMSQACVHHGVSYPSVTSAMRRHGLTFEQAIERYKLPS